MAVSLGLEDLEVDLDHLPLPVGTRPHCHPLCLLPPVLILCSEAATAVVTVDATVDAIAPNVFCCCCAATAAVAC